MPEEVELFPVVPATSRTAWQNIGGFDELLFTGLGEDVDWSLRVGRLDSPYEPALYGHRESFSTVRNGWQAIQLYYALEQWWLCGTRPLVALGNFLPFLSLFPLSACWAISRHD
jgi:GT2 family glycosyltransferase